MKSGSRTVVQALIWYCFCISLTSFTRSSVSASNDLNLLGVDPSDYKYYKDGLLSSTQKLKCKDGSKQFSKSQFNDDFCDCPDGSDEPGTSACPNGKFHCKNAGHVPLFIYSSRVNDGICDCCDGSDEYDGRIKCTNTCWEAGNAARDRLKKKIATYQQGATIRRQEVEQAKVVIAKEEAELAKLKSEEKILKGLVEQLKERKEQIEKAEEKERLQKEKEEKERLQKEKEEKEAKEANISGVDTTGNNIHDSSGVQEGSSSSQGCAFCDKVWDAHQRTYKQEVDGGDDHGPLPEVGNTEESQDGAVKDEREEAGHPGEDSPHDVSKIEEETISNDEVGHGIEGKETTEDPAPLSREELGRQIASRWTGEKTKEETKDSDADSSSDHGNSEDIDESIYEEDNYETDEEDLKHEDDKHKYDDEEEHKYDDDTEEPEEDTHDEDQVDTTSSYNSDDEFSEPSDTDSSSSWLEKIRTTVRKILNAVTYFQGPVDQSEAAHVRKEYDESSTKLTKIQSRISSLTKKLKHDFGPDKQFHSFYGQCFEIKQNKYVYKICPFKEASQVEGYSTTRLGNWDKFEETYRAMQFSNGDKCWNGPDRSLKVKLRCGLKNEATDVDEPSRCEYVALLATPAVCHDDKLKELENKLELMNMEHQNQSHDEL